MDWKNMADIIYAVCTEPPVPSVMVQEREMEGLRRGRRLKKTYILKTNNYNPWGRDMEKDRENELAQRRKRQKEAFGAEPRIPYRTRGRNVSSERKQHSREIRVKAKNGHSKYLLPIHFSERGVPGAIGYLQAVRAGENQYSLVLNRVNISFKALVGYDEIARQKGVSLLEAVETFNYPALARESAVQFGKIAKDYAQFKALVETFAHYEVGGKNYFIAHSTIESLNEDPKKIGNEDIACIVLNPGVTTLEKGSNIFVAPNKGLHDATDQTRYRSSDIAYLLENVFGFQLPEKLINPEDDIIKEMIDINCRLSFAEHTGK